MLNKIQGYFSPEDAGSVSLKNTEEHTKLAVATVLLSAAKADAHFAKEERVTLLEQLEKRLGISREEAISLEAQAEVAEHSHLLSQYTDLLVKELSVSQREFILALAWSLITADQKVAQEESAFAVKLRVSLGLSLEQSLRARKSAEGLKQDGFKEMVEASKEVHDSIATQLAQLFGRKKSS